MVGSGAGSRTIAFLQELIKVRARSLGSVKMIMRAVISAACGFSLANLITLEETQTISDAGSIWIATAATAVAGIYKMLEWVTFNRS
jgi:hypothetical protein